MNYYTNNSSQRREALDRARLVRKERGAAPASSYNPLESKSFGNLFQNSKAMDGTWENFTTGWQEKYEKDEHKYALETQKKGFELEGKTNEIAQKAQEEAQKRAQGQQRRRSFLGLASTAASFIPGVGPLISAGISAFG